MKNKNLPIILLVIGLVIALMAAIYLSHAVPSFNGALDTVFHSIFKGSVKQDKPASEKSAAPVEKKETPAKKRSTKDVYEITNNGYTLASIGKIQWLYESTWPFVTEPFIHNQTVISVTAEPSFITLSYETGELLSKENCPIYPGEKSFQNGNILTLSGRDGKDYTFTMNDDLSFTDMRSVETENVPGSFLSRFAPADKAVEAMKSRLKIWTADDSCTLPEMKLYTGHINEEGNGNFWAQQIRDETNLFVFTPDKQAMYQIGLADVNGAWISANAFVAVFGESGDLKQVSLDYVANKPVIKLHLSDSEIYYIVAGWAKDMYDGTETWLQIAESR